MSQFSENRLLDKVVTHIVPPTKAQERMRQKLDEFNAEAAKHNIEREKELRRLQSSTAILHYYCNLCQGKLIKHKTKTVQKEIGGTTVVLPKWKCSVCGSWYSGFKANLHLLSNDKIVADCVEFDAQKLTNY